MNWADYAIVIIIVVSVLLGVLRGFVREVLGVVGWVLAFWVAFHFYKDAGLWYETAISSPDIRNVVGFATLLFLMLIICGVITWLIGTLLRDSPLAAIDRTLGGGFGILRGLFIVAAFLLAAGATTAKNEPWWNQSLFIPKLDWLTESLRAVVPPTWLQKLQPAPSKSNS